MKRILSLFTATALVFSLAGCSSSSTEAETATENETEKLSVITTIFPQYDFVREIAGDAVELDMLLALGAESHSYDPTPQDIIAIQNCDLFIYTGGENDVWVDEILADMGEDAPQTLKLLDCVDTVEEEIVEGMEHSHAEDEVCTDPDCDHDHEEEAAVTEEEHDHEEEAAVTEEEHDHDHEEEAAVTEEEHDHDHEEEAAVTEEEHDHEEEGEIDEHVWTSPKNAIAIVSVITDILSEKDTANAELFSTNSLAYIAELNELDAAFQSVVDEAENNVVLFGDRFPFRYLADEYGIEYFAAFTGCSTETEASAATVAFLIEKVNELSLPVVFTIELSTGKIADAICESTDAVNLVFHSCHNLTRDEFDAGETYLSIMTQNVEALRTALN